MNVETLVPALAEQPIESVVAGLAAAPSSRPFSQPLLDFVGEFSRVILADRAMRAYPELIAMAHWFRRANMLGLQRKFDAEKSGRMIKARGLAFHIAPANVDSVFIYSWLLSLLCGNANLVRLSQTRSQQIAEVVAVLNAVLDCEQFGGVRAANAVISYGHDDSITRHVSERCQLRVIWGGDSTVTQIRNVPLSPLAAEMVFADRFSMALLKASAVLDCADEALERLAGDFYNDAFWFNQQACSSPRTVIWQGDEAAVAAARTRFWRAVSRQIAGRRPDNEPAQVMARVTTAFLVSSVTPHAVVAGAPSDLPTRIEIGDFDAGMRAMHCGNGFFFETRRDTLSDTAEIFSDRDQTLAVYGYSREEIAALLERTPVRAIDRVVRIGSALSFGPVWDGYDFFTYFTRETRIDV